MNPTSEQVDRALADLRADAVKARADEFLERSDPTLDARTILAIASEALDDFDVSEVPHDDLDALYLEALALSDKIREKRRTIKRRELRCIIAEHLGEAS